jgi:phenylalanyl-tRNA synthetase beta chain
MLVPLKWLKQYVDINVSPEEFAKAMTMTGSNVESINLLGKDIQGVVVGLIESVEPHPNADKLVVCSVDIGNKKVSIVTGATNIKQNDKVPIAVDGAVLPGGTVITVTDFRGIVSQGMMCSAQELGIDPKGLPEDQRNGILILHKDAEAGSDVKRVLGLDDVVVEFEITPNRPDCLSITGIAREAAVTFNTDFKMPNISVEKGKGDLNDYTSVKILDTDLCLRYTARIVDNVKIKPSPIWMQQRLSAAGVRPINNIVDITNYVMLELGQPLHAFDFDSLKDHKIIVRRAKDGEIIKTLDGIERKLDSDVLVIADTEKAIGLAGIMGGENTEITNETRRVLVESANFNRANIRKSSRRLGLRTEASSRYEKGLDPKLAKLASDRFIQLVTMLDAGEVIEGIIDEYPNPLKPRVIQINPQKINGLLGSSIPTAEMIRILEALEIKVSKAEGDTLNVIPPTFRDDISREADLVEEIGRIYGYNQIESTIPKSNVRGQLNREQVITDKAKSILNACGYSEILTFSFVSPKVFDHIRIPNDDPLRRVVTLMNPLGEEQSIMRTTLIPNMLDIIASNLNYKETEIRLFELGTVYRPDKLPLEQLPLEPRLLTMGACEPDMDFYRFKGALETLFKSLRVREVTFRPVNHPTFHPGRAANIYISGKQVGIIGEIHPNVTKNYGVVNRIYITECEFSPIINNSNRELRFTPLPKYPGVIRDIALIVSDSVLADNIKSEIFEAGGPLLREVLLFDVYKGSQIPDDMKSIDYSLVYRSDERTLTDEEVDLVQNGILTHLKNKFNARLRV